MLNSNFTSKEIAGRDYVSMTSYSLQTYKTKKCHVSDGMYGGAKGGEIVEISPLPNINSMF